MCAKTTPTIQSITDGLTKLLREVRLLQTETRSLTERLHSFTEKHPVPPAERTFDHDWVRRESTDEPHSMFRAFLYEIKETDDLETPTRALIAVLKDLDGALRDIRAARSDIDAITNDSDLRGEFLDWIDK